MKIFPKEKKPLIREKFLTLRQSTSNSQIPIFEVPYKYIKNSLRACSVYKHALDCVTYRVIHKLLNGGTIGPQFQERMTSHDEKLCTGQKNI